jgi:hypothetical protein
MSHDVDITARISCSVKRNWKFRSDERAISSSNSEKALCFKSENCPLFRRMFASSFKWGRRWNEVILEIFRLVSRECFNIVLLWVHIHWNFCFSWSY